MLKVFDKSLLIRLGLAMAAITVLAILGMLSSVFIAETSEGQAAAINQAGTLRMQSYRIASSLAHYTDVQQTARLKRSAALIQEFEQRLNSHRLTGVLAKSSNQQLLDSYTRVQMQWLQQIQPLLDTYIITASQKSLSANNVEVIDGLRTSYLEAVDPFVAEIDDMVKLLEIEAEQQIQLLRMIQLVSLFLTILVVFFTMYLINTSVLIPLRDLLGCASAVRRGDFSRRTRVQSEDELGQLAYTFNLMAEDLSRTYSDLENRVHEKTADLEQRNQSLELLYNTTRNLSEIPLANAVYEELLEDIKNMVGTGPGFICLGDTGARQAFKLTSTHPALSDQPDICNPPNCQGCFESEDPHSIEIICNSEETLRLFSTPIKDKEKQYGVLLVEILDGRPLQAWQERLLQTVASHIAIALNIARRHSQDRMLALLEERSVIARELHDSLAQSLSYLKIQVSRLDALIPQPDNTEQVKLVTAELRDGLNSAYRQLRELLTTFRLRIDEAGLSDALIRTVEEFSRRSNLEIELDNHLGNGTLTANAEVHVIQVVREALSNVLRHAQAEHAVVSLEYSTNNDVKVAIEDDGIGMPGDTERRHHYGLAIMKERAHGLEGELSVSPSALGGTRIELVFNAAGRRHYRDGSQTTIQANE